MDTFRNTRRTRRGVRLGRRSSAFLDTAPCSFDVGQRHWLYIDMKLAGGGISNSVGIAARMVSSGTEPNPLPSSFRSTLRSTAPGR